MFIVQCASSIIRTSITRTSIIQTSIDCLNAKVFYHFSLIQTNSQSTEWKVDYFELLSNTYPEHCIQKRQFIAHEY